MTSIPGNGRISEMLDIYSVLMQLIKEAFAACLQFVKDFP
jgi:hypothetical protein